MKLRFFELLSMRQRLDAFVTELLVPLHRCLYTNLDISWKTVQGRRRHGRFISCAQEPLIVKPSNLLAAIILLDVIHVSGIDSPASQVRGFGL